MPPTPTVELSRAPRVWDRLFGQGVQPLDKGYVIYDQPLPMRASRRRRFFQSGFVLIDRQQLPAGRRSLENCPAVASRSGRGIDETAAGSRLKKLNDFRE